MLTEKGYKAIAEILKQAYKSKEIKYVGSVAGRFSSYFQRDNPRFDRDKFMKACGIG